MEPIITNPHQWEVIKELYRPPGSRCEEYHRAVDILNELDKKIVMWRKYYFLTTRRMPQVKKQYYNKMNREYLNYFNGKLNQCSELTLMLRLKI
ncbi:MAG TPA: hypothetical protein VFM18_17920 [Methanosarcina sp.]|nr:hypothetical protein [Methanosarcina sp.]